MRYALLGGDKTISCTSVSASACHPLSNYEEIENKEKALITFLKRTFDVSKILLWSGKKQWKDMIFECCGVVKDEGGRKCI